MGELHDEVVSVRYVVDDVQAAVDFYTNHLNFVLGMANCRSSCGSG